MISLSHVYKDLSIWYAQNRDFGGSAPTKNKKMIFFKSILGTTTFFARPSGDFRYNNCFFSVALRAILGTTTVFFLALRAILGTTTFFARSLGDFRYSHLGFSALQVI